jgi:hypothetical protein
VLLLAAAGLYVARKPIGRWLTRTSGTWIGTRSG